LVLPGYAWFCLVMPSAEGITPDPHAKDTTLKIQRNLHSRSGYLVLLKTWMPCTHGNYQS